MIITLTWEEVSLASAVGLRRRISSLRKGGHERNGLSREKQAEAWYYNIVGACGELAVSKAVGQNWHAFIDAPKADPDIGDDIQVRCLGRSYYDLIVRYDDRDDQKYVLCIGEPPTFTVVGWIWGKNAKQDKWLRDRGSRNAPCYWVPQDELNVEFRDMSLLQYDQWSTRRHEANGLIW